MTTYLKINGTYDELDDLFENCHYLSIRYFNNIGKNLWDVTIRHSENYPEDIEKIQQATTAKELREIDTSRSFRHQD